MAAAVLDLDNEAGAALGFLDRVFLGAGEAEQQDVAALEVIAPRRHRRGERVELEHCPSPDGGRRREFRSCSLSELDRRARRRMRACRTCAAIPSAGLMPIRPGPSQVGFGEGAQHLPGSDGVQGRCGTRPGPSEDAGRVAGGKSGAGSLRSCGRPPPAGRARAGRAPPGGRVQGRALARASGFATCLVSNHPANRCDSAACSCHLKPARAAPTGRNAGPQVPLPGSR